MFRSKLDNLEFVEENDKIGFDKEGILYIDKKRITQSLTRWLYGQTRENSIIKLQELLNEYNILLRFVRIKLSDIRDIYTELLNLSDDIVEFNTKIISGISNLMKTYKYDEPYHKVLSDCTFILSNFEIGF
jgi:hypothetical protein